MARIILVRHGQTEWNRVERFRGRADLDLNEVGLRQALATAERVANWQVAVVYSSPLKRALTTANILANRLGLPVQLLDGLIDIDYGSWQGLSPQEAAERDSGLYTQWLECPHEVRFPGGESLDDVRHRVFAAFEDALAKHSDQTVIFVAHMVVCKVLICAVLGLDNSHFWQVEQGVSAINIFEVAWGTLAASLVNDTCHLRDLAS